MNSEPVDIHNYCSIVGKLIFLTTTKPDIAYAVSSVSRYMSNPQAAHLNVVKHILCYLQKTSDYGLFNQCSQNNKVEGFIDSDWASCPETRRSTGGYLFTLSGAAITWQSKRQLTVARSSMESEYVALSNGAQEAVWLGRLLREIGAPDSQTPPELQQRGYALQSLASSCHSPALRQPIKLKVCQEPNLPCTYQAH